MTFQTNLWTEKFSKKISASSRGRGKCRYRSLFRANWWWNWGGKTIKKWSSKNAAKGFWLRIGKINNKNYEYRVYKQRQR